MESSSSYPIDRLLSTVLRDHHISASSVWSEDICNWFAEWDSSRTVAAVYVPAV